MMRRTTHVGQVEEGNAQDEQARKKGQLVEAGITDHHGQRADDQSQDHAAGIAQVDAGRLPVELEKGQQGGGQAEGQDGDQEIAVIEGDR